MLLLTLFAFVAGVVTIVSPCVLPVLPMLLSTSVGGGRFRPLGIVLGLTATFTAVTLAVAAAAQALAIPASWLRIIAILALALFGLTMLVPSFGRLFEKWLSPLTRIEDTGRRRNGFGGGLLLGSGLGFLWAPCVGPIMATVIATTVLQGISLAAVAITLAYSVGAGVPMLLVSYGTRRFAIRARKLGSRSGAVQRAFGAVTVLACVALFFGLDTRLQTFALKNLPPEWNAALIAFESQSSVQREITVFQNNSPGQVAAQPAAVPTLPPTPRPSIALKDLGPAPELTGITGWINSKPLTLQQLRGKVVVIDFWTFLCYNCANTRPYVQQLYKKYKSQGLEIIGVHTPEFATERVPENIAQAVKEQNIPWPVAMDPDYKTWSAYNNRYWPAFYFIDANGHIRYTHFGEGNYDNNEKVVQQLLSEASTAKMQTTSAQDMAAQPTQAPQAEMPAAAVQATQVPPTAVSPTAVPPTAVAAKVETPARPAALSGKIPAPGLVLSDMGQAPEFKGLTGWINSKPLTLSALKGKVVIVDFWTFACYNCANTRPYVQQLYKKYKNLGLEIVGVHTPELSYERVPENVVNAVKAQDVTWPVALDQDYKTWNAYDNRYWPAFYFIDANGHLRYTHFGEGNYDYNEKVVQQLLSEAGATAR